MRVQAFAKALRRSEALTLEHILTSPDWMGLTTATPLQRAICRIADGLPIDDLRKLPIAENLDAYPDEVKERTTWDLSIPSYTPGTPPSEIYLASAIRSAKSLISISRGLQMSQQADLSALMPGELARFGIVSLTRENAKATFRKLVAAYDYSPRVREIAMGRPTEGRMMLRHPDGHPVEIRVLAGKRGGGSLVSEWLIGAVFDEATRMLSSEEGVVNVDEGRKAARERLLPGCQLWFTGSPWAPMGLVYRTVTQAEDGEVAPGDVVIRATGAALNPSHWSPARYRRLVDSPKPEDREVLLTDGLAMFVDVEGAWFTADDIRHVTRTALRLPYERGVHYFASMDPATRSNAWTIAIAGKGRDGKRRVYHAAQWIPTGGEPLKAKEVLPEIAEMCRAYGISSVSTDQWSDTLIAEIAQESNLYVHSEHTTRASKVERFRTLRELVSAGEVEIPPAANLVDDLKRVRRRLTADGVNVVFPVTADGRHCDYAPSVADAVFRASIEPDPDEEPETKISAAQRAAAEYVQRQNQPWDDVEADLYDEVDFE